MFNTNCGSTFVFDNTNVNKAVVNYAEFNGFVLSSTNDYVVSYARLNGATNQWESIANNSSTGFVDAGTMKLIVTAPNNSVNFEGSAEIPYTINPRDIANATAQLVAGPFVYDGQPQRPAIDSISDSAIGLADLTGNYTVVYKISANDSNEPVIWLL